MTEYRRSAHAVFDIKYHIVWIVKYQYKILRGRLAERARDLIRQTCESRGVIIVRGAVSRDHIHMLVSAPPEIAPSKLVQYLKGRSSRRLQEEFPELRKRFWGQHLCGGAGTSARRWARSTRRRCRSTSRIRNGTMMLRGSKSPSPPSLETALSRGFFRRLQPQADFQS